MADIISIWRDSTDSEDIPSVPPCAVCGNDSEGLRFGQYTCRACAGFFRRTVFEKLQYTCKHDKNCDIEKSARNTCRACRFKKCLQVGMQTSAVQPARSGLGKRKDAKDKPSPAGSDAPAAKIPKSTAQPQYLSKMLEGYHHFLSLRKAAHLTLTLIEERRTFESGSAQEVPQSTFDTSKKMCKIEARLIKDTVEQFFAPFGSLPPEEKSRVLEGFYCIFSNAERAFRTYKTFPAGDDCLLMPDGGYIRLSELQKFYENNNLVRGDSAQVAIESATTYIISVVVAHMRSIDLSEVELMALVGMFLWKDKAAVSEDAMATIRRTRDNILVDLHDHYRISGYAEHDLTIKTANLLLLIPKLENVELAAFFNLMDAAQLPHDVPQQFSGICD